MITCRDIRCQINIRK